MSGFDKNISRICIYDFDGTLVRTEEPETGKELWLNKFGFEWPHRGWWGRAESLDSRIYFKKNNIDSELGLTVNIFENPLIDKTINFYKNDIVRGDTINFLLTGRHLGIGWLVTQIVKEKGLDFNRFIYKTGHLDTGNFKLNVFDELLKQNEQINELVIYEDRLDHLELFNDWGDKQEIKVVIHHIN